MDTGSYLRRIDYSRAVFRDIASLRALQQHHVFAVPFETLDIHHKVPIILSIESLFQKVVLDKRGGYCYELNTLFHRLLSMCGFKVTMISGRILHKHGYGREFEHMALLVELDGQRWLVDVGYGDFAVQPLAIVTGEIQSDGRTFYQIVDKILVDGKEYLGVAKWNDSKQTFKIEYVFTLTPRVLADFEEMNYFHQTSAESHFAKGMIVTLPLLNGRMSMINNKIVKTENGQKQSKSILNEEHREKILEKYFHMDMVYLV